MSFSSFTYRFIDPRTYICAGTLPQEVADKFQFPLERFSQISFDANKKEIVFEVPSAMSLTGLMHVLSYMEDSTSVKRDGFSRFLSLYTELGIPVPTEFLEKEEEEQTTTEEGGEYLAKGTDLRHEDTSCGSILQLAAKRIQYSRASAYKSGYSTVKPREGECHSNYVQNTYESGNKTISFGHTWQFNITRATDVLNGFTLKFLLPALPEGYVWVDDIEERLIESITLELGPRILECLDGKGNRMLAHIKNLWPKYHNRYTGQSPQFQRRRSAQPFELTIPIVFLMDDHKLQIVALKFMILAGKLRIPSLKKLVSSDNNNNNNNTLPTTLDVALLVDGVMLENTDRKMMSKKTSDKCTPSLSLSEKKKEEEEEESMQERNYVLDGEGRVWKKNLCGQNTPLMPGPFHDAIKKYLMKREEVKYGKKGIVLKRQVDKLLQWIVYDDNINSLVLLDEEGEVDQTIQHRPLLRVLAEMRGTPWILPTEREKETTEVTPLKVNQYPIQYMENIFRGYLNEEKDFKRLDLICSHPVTYFLVHVQASDRPDLMRSPEMHPFERLELSFNGNTRVHYKARDAADYVWKQCNAKAPPHMKKWYLIPLSKEAITGTDCASSANTSRIDRVTLTLHGIHLRDAREWEVNVYAVTENILQYNENGTSNVFYTP